MDGGRERDGSLPRAICSEDEASGTFREISPLSAGRRGHTATLLLDGTVLVAGGEGAPSGVEIYDPMTQSWSRGPDLAHAHTDHTATLLRDGRVLIVGGDRASELYDPRARAWSSAGVTAIVHHGHTATMLADGRVLIAAGLGESNDNANPAAEVELFDPARSTWDVVGSLEEPRWAAQTARIANGRVLIAGGHNGHFSVERTDVFDPATLALSRGPDMRAARWGHRATLLDDDRVLVTGGAPAGEIFDPIAQAWIGTPRPGFDRALVLAGVERERFGYRCTRALRAGEDRRIDLSSQRARARHRGMVKCAQNSTSAWWVFSRRSHRETAREYASPERGLGDDLTEGAWLRAKERRRARDIVLERPTELLEIGGGDLGQRARPRHRVVDVLHRLCAARDQREELGGRIAPRFERLELPGEPGEAHHRGAGPRVSEPRGIQAHRTAERAR